MNTNVIKKMANAVNPPLQIGGLEIEDSYIRYAAIKGKKADFVSVKLEPGIIEDGKIKDKERLYGVLKGFHDQIAGKKKKIWVIASISDSNVYTEMFVLPKGAMENLAEAVRLNLEMISPIDFNTAYADWHLVGEKEINGVGQYEILGAFIAKQFIDDFEEIADKAGFEIAAIEFPMLALTRSITELSEQFDKKKNYLVFRLGSDGVSFGLVKNGELYFLHFVGWSSVYGAERRATLESLKKMVVDEIHKVLNFYETHWDGTLTELLLVTPTFEKEIQAAITEHFPKLAVEVPRARQFAGMSIGWLSGLGSAFRGIIPRDEDTLISLATAGTKDKYEAYQKTNFVRLWRNVTTTVLVGVLALFIGLDVLVTAAEARLGERSAELSQNPATGKLDALQQEATLFNGKVALLEQAKEERLPWSGFFRDMQAMAGPNITLKRILIQDIGAPVTVFGEATTQTAIGEFEKALKANAKLKEVNFQLSSVTTIEGGKHAFSMSFKIKTL